MWLRLSDEARMELAQKKGDMIEERFQNVSDQRKRRLAAHAFKYRLLKKCYQLWVEWAQTQLAITASLHATMMKNAHKVRR